MEGWCNELLSFAFFSLLEETPKNKRVIFSSLPLKIF